MLIIGGSGSRKRNLLLNLIENQQDIDKIYLYAKDPYESKYQYPIDILDVYKNIDEYNSDKENKILTVFDMISDMIHNKKLNSIVTELFIRGRKLNISIIFITQSYFLRF